LKKILKWLRKKAKWKALNPKTRNLCSRLFVCFLCCLVVMLGCEAAVTCEISHFEIFWMLEILTTMAFVTLGFSAMAVNFAGVVISRAERYQRSDPMRQKCMKKLFFSRSITARAASYRAGHARSHRRASRSAFSSAASKNSSDDGESDSSDPPGPSYSVTPFQTFYRKPNSFSSLWRFLRGPGCWCMRFCSAHAGRGRGK
jgi:hypothetical protein